tara:strand:+ start:2553 stop:2684 length:132 start_codon:yes stop_codon:yes gene_type:complete
MGQEKNPITEMVAFLDGQPETIKAYQNLGVLPWWAYERLKISF